MNFHLKKMNGVRYFVNQSLSNYTSMQVGGETAVIAQPEDQDALICLIEYLNDSDIPWYLLGGGTNTIFGEDGFPGVVIRLGQGFRFLERIGDNRIHVGAACLLPFLLEKSMEFGFSGLEFCYGIPGTVGGAVAGNAGMDGLGLHDFISGIQGVTRTADKVNLKKEDYSYGYRRVEWPEFPHRGKKVSFDARDNDLVVTSIMLELGSMKQDEQRSLLERYKNMRSKQPAFRGTSGSIFKNPAGDYAGRLIEAAGLKGKHVGDALVSPAHGNWIVNNGRASARDVLTLISIVQKTVFRQFGIKLEPEVKIVAFH